MEKVHKKKRLGLLIWPSLFVLIFGGYIFWVTTRALPTIDPINSTINLSAKSSVGSFAWPNYGQSAIGISGLGVLASSGQQKPSPTASTAKVITALAVLSKKPISLGDQGPVITLGPSDVALYQTYLAENGSVMQVTDGEKISEYQMLQAMLLPSADNIADSLAIWAFGSLTSYQTYANQFIKENGLNDTNVGQDASGYDPSSTSTATDLIKLGILANQSPIVAQIVSMSTASGIPVVGTIKNVNVLLGTNSINGIKTGNTDQAGGVFLSSSKINVNNQPITVFTSIMNASSLWVALHSSLSLATSVQNNFSLPTPLTKIKKGTIVGGYIIPWNNQRINAVSSGNINLVTWNGNTLNSSLRLKSIKQNEQSDSIVGQIISTSSLPSTSYSLNVVLEKGLTSKPSKWWLITHPSYVL